jgi:ribosomal protein L37AE/L43A
MRRHGQQIECPHCGDVSRVGHLAWSALKCTACKAYVEKVAWIDVTSETDGFMDKHHAALTPPPRRRDR